MFESHGGEKNNFPALEIYSELPHDPQVGSEEEMAPPFGTSLKSNKQTYTGRKVPTTYKCFTVELHTCTCTHEREQVQTYVHM